MYRQIGNCKYNFDIPPPIQIQVPPMEIRLEEKTISNVSSPDTWGPAMWFMNHLGSISAPEVIPLDKREKYWHYIDGLPEILPCKKCSVHARAYVDQYSNQKDIICSSRDNLVRFFVDFHNSVNERTGKPKITYDEVYKMFSGPVSIKKFRYQNTQAS